MNNKFIYFIGGYIVWDNVDVYICVIKDVYCVLIQSYCICQCKIGYIWKDGQCLEGKILFFLII